MTQIYLFLLYLLPFFIRISAASKLSMLEWSEHPKITNVYMTEKQVHPYDPHLLSSVKILSKVKTQIKLLPI